MRKRKIDFLRIQMSSRLKSLIKNEYKFNTFFNVFIDKKDALRHQLQRDAFYKKVRSGWIAPD